MIDKIVELLVEQIRLRNDYYILCNLHNKVELKYLKTILACILPGKYSALCCRHFLEISLEILKLLE